VDDAGHNDLVLIAASTVYGLSLTLLYTASTLYHSFRLPRLKYVFKIVDHCAIYLLIAGSYTPITLVVLKGWWGWTLFALVFVLVGGLDIALGAMLSAAQVAPIEAAHPSVTIG
jgi:hemolysin III